MLLFVRLYGITGMAIAAFYWIYFRETISGFDKVLCIAVFINNIMYVLKPIDTIRESNFMLYIRNERGMRDANWSDNGKIGYGDVGRIHVLIRALFAFLGMFAFVLYLLWKLSVHLWQG